MDLNIKNKLAEVENNCNLMQKIDIKKNNNDKMPINYSALLSKVFVNQKHLNCQEIELQNYLVFDNHALGEGTFGTIFLGSNKKNNKNEKFCHN